MMVHVCSFVLFLPLFCILSVSCDTEEMLILGPNSFGVALQESALFVKFYAPWCGHCKSLAPIWEDLAIRYNMAGAPIKIAKIDCTVNVELCSKHEVKGYPTLKLFKMGNERGLKYKGERTFPEFISFLKTQLLSDGVPREQPLPVKDKTQSPASTIPRSPGGVYSLTYSTFKDFVQHGKHFIKFYVPWCGHCKSMAEDWESLALKYKYDMELKLSEVDCQEHETVCQSLLVKGYPTLVWMVDGKKVDEYIGTRVYSLLYNFVEDLLTPDLDDDDDVEPPSAIPYKAKVDPYLHDDIDSEIDMSQFEGYDEEHKAQMINLERERIKERRTLMESEKLEQQKNVREAEAHKHAKDLNTEKHVVKQMSQVVDIDGARFDQLVQDGPLLVVFHDPHCSACKTWAHTYDEVSYHQDVLDLASKVVFARVDCTKHAVLCRDNRVHPSDYPSTTLYMGGNKHHYLGSRQFNSLRSFIVDSHKVYYDNKLHAEMIKEVEDQVVEKKDEL